MEIAQERESAEAQKIALSVDMVSAANRHLRFLAAVDQTGHLAAEGLVQVRRFWGEMFPEEPYELDFLEDAPLKPEKIITDYDLASAIERQEFLLLAGFKALYE